MSNDVTYFIPKVVLTSTCSKHNAIHGEACYVIHSSSRNRAYPAICDSRARASGMNGVISPEALSRSARLSRHQNG